MVQRKRDIVRQSRLWQHFSARALIIKIVLCTIMVVAALGFMVGATVWDQYKNGNETSLPADEAIKKQNTISEHLQREDPSDHIQGEEYDRWFNKPRVKAEVVVEAGATGVDVASFLIDKNEKAFFVGDLSTIDLKIPGDYRVSIQAGPRVYESTLKVVDTIPPKLTHRDLIVPLHSDLSPEAFIETMTDETDVRLSFLDRPKPDVLGLQKVTIIAEDGGGNKTTVSCKVTFVWLKEEIKIEAGRKSPLTVEEFLLGEQLPEGITLSSDLKKIAFNRVGRKKILFHYKGEELNCYVHVVDTIKPSAKPVDRTTFAGVALKPSHFVKDVKDATSVKCIFVKQPNFKQVGTSTVDIDVVDEGNNRLRLRSKLTVMSDSVPPVLYGVRDFTYFRGDNRSFMLGVYAKDDRDPKPKVTVDRSRVNENIPGTYTVLYTARDASGNTSSRSAQVTVRHRTPYRPKRSTGNSQLDQLCDSVLRQIVNGDMSLYQQGQAVMQWLSRSFRYRSQENRTDWIGGAIRGLSQRNGDCFIYQFSNRALLTRLGIPNYSMKNDAETHSWVMVTLGGRTFVSDALPRYRFYGISLQEAQKRGPKGAFRWAGAQEKIMKVEEVFSPIPFKVIEENDATLFTGERVIRQEGVDGLKRSVYDVEYINGVESWRKLRTSSVEKEPVNQIVCVGTKAPTTPTMSPTTTTTQPTTPTTQATTTTTATTSATTTSTTTGETTTTTQVPEEVTTTQETTTEATPNP